MKRLRLLAFVQKRPGISPGQRFRLEQWMPHLESKHGIDLELRVFESPRLTSAMYEPGKLGTKGSLMLWDFARRVHAVREARKFDGALVYREVATLGPALWERVLERLDVPFILDFDDAIWLPSSVAPKRPVNGVFSKLRFAGKTRTIAKLASAVSVGNEFLASWASEVNSNVHVVPTSIDLDKYTVQSPVSDSEPFTIGWIGSHSTLPYLEEVREAVETFALRRKTRFIVICDRPLEPGYRNVVENVFLPWNGATEAADIGKMHVGIMPLVDTMFTRGKCACKALQYMAVGRPAVISPVGVNLDVVKHGENGFFASTTEEWIDAFEKLAESRDLQERFGVAGRRTVEERYTAEASAARFAGAVRSMFGATTEQPTDPERRAHEAHPDHRRA